jgi:hypothetical protein
VPLLTAAGLDTTTLGRRIVMVVKHCTSGRPVPAVAYYPMSDGKQENSIERQRSQVEAHAARQGYVILREYVDEGLAGDEEEKRKGFMRPIRDAATLRDFQVICATTRTVSGASTP